jgi:tetratricopeptide (TPR) repeat protein
MLRTERGAWLVGAVVVASLSAAAAVWAWRRTEPRDAKEARSALAAGRFAAAEAPLLRWLKARPDSAEAHFLKGRVALARGDLPGAAAGMKRATELGYPRPQLALLGALIASKLGRHAEAEPILRHAFLAAQGPDPQLDEALARVYLETYDLDRAATVIERWIREAPDDPQPFLWRTEVDSRTTAHPTAALNDYREALKRDPTLAKARLGLADELRKAHSNAEAAVEYDAYLALKPDDAAGHLGAGQNRMEMGDETAATRHLERALALDPKNASALIELAEYDLRRAEFARSLAYLDRAIKLDPFDPTIRRRRGLALTRLGRVEEAKIEQAASQRLQTELDHLDEVREHLIQSPHDRSSQLEVARWMFDHGHDAEGVRWAEKVLREQPGNAEANRLLAEYHERHGNPGLANFYRLQDSSGPRGGSTTPASPRR